MIAADRADRLSGAPAHTPGGHALTPQRPTWSRRGRLRLIDPLGYLDFVGLMERARVVLTDSGGIQEETTILGVPCLTLRENTERPITLTRGTNHGRHRSGAHRGGLATFKTEPVTSVRPPLWDGQTAGRIVSILRTALASH